MMSSTCFKNEVPSLGRRLYVQVRYVMLARNGISNLAYTNLYIQSSPEEGTSRSKHVEDI